MNNFSDFERAQQIDRYLAGRLSTEETQQVEAAMQQDSAWQQAYEDAKLSRTITQEFALRDEIRSIRASMQNESSAEAVAEPTVSAPVVSTPTVGAPTDTAERSSDSSAADTKVRPMFPAYLGRIAAGLALLLVGFLGFQYATLSGDSLYAERATVYQMAASRSSETTDDTPEDLLEQHYRAQRYAEATAAYEQMPDPSLTVMFLAGNAYLQQDKTDQAIAAFREIVRINGSQGVNRFEEDAQYYLAMSYLKADLPQKAIPLLEEINDTPQHSYRALVSDYYLWKVKFFSRFQ
ncbi:MAG: tetratricopeptide repeat protein [Tunicatimonas sp.]